jgi:hypothetical protein
LSTKNSSSAPFSQNVQDLRRKEEKREDKRRGVEWSGRGKKRNEKGEGRKEKKRSGGREERKEMELV